MYCPKCGAEAVEGQRFCKACGTNLQLIINIVKGGGKGPGPWQFDPEELKRNIQEFAHSWKSGWGQYEKGRPFRQSATDLRRRAKEEIRRRNLPQPNQWMGYSQQHHFKEGLIRLFGGGAMAYAFFRIGQEVLNSGIIHEIPNIKDPQAHGLEVLARIFWLFMLVPLFKGLGQLIYASFFAESMQTLSERFTIPSEELNDEDRVTMPKLERKIEQKVERQTAPQVQVGTDPHDFDQLHEPPSVTEGTTQFFEEARAQRRRESQ